MPLLSHQHYYPNEMSKVDDLIGNGRELHESEPATEVVAVHVVHDLAAVGVHAEVLPGVVGPLVSIDSFEQLRALSFWS